MIRIGDAPLAAPTNYVREVIVAQGEVTGHAHRVSGTAIVALDERGEIIASALAGQIARHEIERVRQLSLPAGARIMHEEHRTLDIMPGLYDVVIQRTRDQMGRWRQVVD